MSPPAKHASPPVVAAPEKIPRIEAAKILGVTAPMLDVLEFQGRIKAERVNGRVYFYSRDVQTLAKSYAPAARAKKRLGKGKKPVPGGVAAAVFSCFERGIVEVGKVVIATKADVETVRKLYCEWKTPLQCED